MVQGGEQRRRRRKRRSNIKKLTWIICNCILPVASADQKRNDASLGGHCHHTGSILLRRVPLCRYLNICMSCPAGKPASGQSLWPTQPRSVHSVARRWQCHEKRTSGLPARREKKQNNGAYSQILLCVSSLDSVPILQWWAVMASEAFSSGL